MSEEKSLLETEKAHTLAVVEPKHGEKHASNHISQSLDQRRRNSATVPTQPQIFDGAEVEKLILAQNSHQNPKNNNVIKKLNKEFLESEELDYFLFENEEKRR